MDIHFQRKTSADPNSGLTALQAQADQGDAEAQFGLGLHYSSANGDAVDFARAARWYRKAADQDHALAQFNLGVMFSRGQGMPPDYAAATDWMHKAAEGGDAGGQHHFGVCCHRASLDTLLLGAAESRIEAFKWLNLAAAQGYSGSLTACETVSLTMTRAEVDEANHRAASFVVRKPSNPALQ